VENGKDIKMYKNKNTIKSFLYVLDTYDNKRVKHISLYNVKSSCNYYIIKQIIKKYFILKGITTLLTIKTIKTKK